MKSLAKILNIFAISLLAYPVFSQNESDVLRFSQTFTGGTARSIGMGGAFGALGADMSSLSLNPAGIGVYRSSEFAFTPSILSTDSKATLYSDPYTDSRNKFNFSNIGYVFTANSNKDEGWVSGSFGIAYNRLNDFNNYTTISGNNPNSSMLDEFTGMLNQYYNGIGVKPSSVQNIGDQIANNFYNYENLAYKTGAIFIDDPVNGTVDRGYFVNDPEVAGRYNEHQQRLITTNGGIGEYAFSLGANYSNKFYIGMTVGVDNVDYEENKVHTENGFDNPKLSDFTFRDNFHTYGVGYNVKLGVIFRPVPVFRLGLALHTPTWYSLSSEFSTSMDVNYKEPIYDNNSATHFSESTDVTTYDYNVTTPMKGIVSAALQLGQLGILSADYEYVDYTKAKIRASDDPFTDVNDSIQTIYKAANNLRLGGELKLGDFAIRAGYGLYGSPFNSKQFNKDAFTTTYSAGLGFRGKGFYFDLGYILMNTSSKYKMYSYEAPDQQGYYVMTPELVNLKNSVGRFVATIGFRF